MKSNFNIQKFLSLDDYATEERIQRRKGSKGTQEFYTPFEIIKRMCDKLSPDTWTDFSKTILEPTAGNYQFVCYVLYKRLENCKSQEDLENAISTIYSVELMQDNVDEGKQRLYDLINIYGYEITDKVKDIINYNNVCSDFFKWDFENWCPIKENKCEALF